MLEKTIYSQLCAYFNYSKLCFDNQYGFRQKHFAECASLELVDKIITQMDKNDVQFSIFLDLSKAFDTTDHLKLFNKLRYYVLDGSTLNLFKSCLNNQSQYLKFENAKSDILSVNIGVPKVFIIGPSLFIIYIYIYINDFPIASEMFNLLCMPMTQPYLAPSNPLIYQTKTLNLQ